MNDADPLLPSWPRVLATSVLVLAATFFVARAQMPRPLARHHWTIVAWPGALPAELVLGQQWSTGSARAHTAAMRSGVTEAGVQRSEPTNQPQSRPAAPFWPWLAVSQDAEEGSLAGLEARLGEAAPPAASGFDPGRAVVATREGAPVYFGGLSEAEFREKETRCLATAIYYEARSEPIEGQLAVAQVIMNRIRTQYYPATVCGVVYEGAERRTGCQFSFTCGGAVSARKDAPRWQQALDLAQKVADGQVWLKSIGYATHYHATYVSPAWTREMNRIQQIGRHIFYRPKSFRPPLGEVVAN